MFAGKKFWVAQRVPLRGFRIDQIKQHGGQPVILEKQADYLIWDHIKPDGPPGALSWTFIEQSVNNGQLEDVQDHVCGPPVGTVRQVGSRTSARSGREPFTSQDDKTLYKWAIEAERMGISVNGNEIWKQLERVVGVSRLSIRHASADNRDRTIDTHGSRGVPVGLRS